MLQLEKERWIYSLTEFLRSGNIPAAHWESVKQPVSSIASHSFCVFIEPFSGLWRWAEAGNSRTGSLRFSNQPIVPQCCTCSPLCYNINHSLWWHRGIHAGRTYGDLSVWGRLPVNKKNCISIVYAIPDISCTNFGCFFFLELLLTGSILSCMNLLLRAVAAAR